MTDRLARRLRSFLAPFADLRALIAIALLAGFAWAFIVIAEEVLEGDTRALDEWLLLALRRAADPAVPIGPAWLPEIARDVTALGGHSLLTLVTLSTALYLWMARRPGSALLVVLAAAGASLWIVLFKLGFARPRPDLVPHGVQVFSASFPSGHSAGAAAVYLTLGALLARFQRRRRLKAYFIGCAVAIAVLVGLSRIYLGVHWPSDVLAGWALGGFWAVACWLVADRLRRTVLRREDDTQLSSSAASSAEPAVSTTVASPRAGGNSRST